MRSSGTKAAEDANPRGELSGVARLPCGIAGEGGQAALF